MTIILTVGLATSGITRDPEFPHKILWSDESKFQLNGAANRPNCRYWREEAPDIYLRKLLSQKELRYGGGWCSDDIVRPLFFEDNGESYLQLLQSHVLPYIESQFEEVVFQQDGAPAHYANVVRNLQK